MNCRKSRALFSDFYDHGLDQKSHKALKAHLSSCSECQKEYDSFNKIMIILKKLKKYDVPRDYIKDIRSF
jgi:predicted anti-sigma-YlaC factor YlaD